jgi:hypothetical protein
MANVLKKSFIGRSRFIGFDSMQLRLNLGSFGLSNFIQPPKIVLLGNWSLECKTIGSSVKKA